MTTLELCDRAGLDDNARKLAEKEVPVRTLIEELARGGRVREAVNSLVQVLPKGDAIAWGLESIRRVDVALLHRGGQEAIQHVEEWLKEPSEERRRAAKVAADRAGLRVGDVIVDANGTADPSSSQVAELAKSGELLLRVKRGDSFFYAALKR